MNDASIKDKVIVLTGSSGKLGQQYTDFLLREGAIVCGLDLENSFETLSDKKNFFFFKTNITQKNSIKETCNEIIKSFGKIDVLINNAGIDSPPNSTDATVSFEDLKEEIWDQTLDVNLKGIFLCCQIIGSEMSKQNYGSIINISSIYGMVSPDQSLYEYKRSQGNVFYKPITYAVSKGGIYNLTRYLAIYWAKSNVRVNTLTISGVFDNQEADFVEAYEKRIPIGRMAKPQDYFGAIKFLSSDSSRYMIGSNLVIDGGWTAI